MEKSNQRLDGRVAVVTGGASGIGAGCVAALAEAGAQVVVLDANEAGFAEARKGAPEGTVFEKLEVTDPAAVDAMAETLFARFGRIDILVNCAGIGRRSAAEDITPEEWRLVLDVNLNGTFWCAQAFGKRMMADGKGGSIVSIGSISGNVVVRPQHNAHYNVSKAAVHHLTKTLATEWATRGVRVNAIAPGFVETAMTAYAMQQDTEMTDVWLKNTPLNRVAQVSEIANIVVFLNSDAASFMTGSIVVADGGYTSW